MRPKSIVMFERLFLISLVVGLVALVMTYGDASAVWEHDPNVRHLGLGKGFLLGGVAVTYALYLALWFLVARKARAWAKWILVVVVALSVIALASTFSPTLNLAVVINVTAYALEVAALVFLFRHDAKAWFGKARLPDAATSG